MKKLLFSMIALGVLSSSAFAGPGIKALKVNAASKVAVGKSSLKAVEEIKESKESAATYCTYTLKVYDGGKVVGTYRHNYTVWSNWSGGSNFQSCGAWVRAMRAMYSEFVDIHPGSTVYGEM